MRLVMYYGADTSLLADADTSGCWPQLEHAVAEALDAL